MLALLFSAGVGLSVLLAYTIGMSSSLRALTVLSEAVGLGGLLTGGCILAAAALHHARFQVPIDWAIGAGGGVLALFGVVGLVFGPRVLVYGTELVFLAGLIVFAMAMRLDFSDPERRTRRSDAAFWMHLIAAPMLIHPLVTTVAGPVWRMDTVTALLMLAIFTVVALVALVIDRRALLVSSLLYTGSALVYLIQQAGLGGGQATLAVTLLSLAVVVLSLSAFWRTIRTRLVPLLPLGRLASRLPPPGAANV
jgi:hypothetical protein